MSWSLFLLGTYFTYWKSNLTKSYHSDVVKLHLSPQNYKNKISFVVYFLWQFVPNLQSQLVCLLVFIWENSRLFWLSHHWSSLLVYILDNLIRVCLRIIQINFKTKLLLIMRIIRGSSYASNIMVEHTFHQKITWKMIWRDITSESPPVNLSPRVQTTRILSKSSEAFSGLFLLQ